MHARWGTKVKVGLVVLVTAAVAGLGVGCTPPTSDWQAENQAVSVGNFIFFVLYAAACQANNGVCPFPIAPSDPPASVGSAPPAPGPAAPVPGAP